MTEDVHEQCIGAICTVQLLPLPVGTNPRSLRCGVNFFEAFAPRSIAADSPVRIRMEVSMSAIVVSPKDNAGNLPIRALVQKSIHRCESEIAQTEFAPQTQAAWEIEGWLLDN